MFGPMAFEARWRDAIVAALLPDHAVSPAFWDDFGRTSPIVLRLGVRAAVLALWLCPPLVLGHLRTFGGLDVAAQAVVLARVAGHRIHVVRQLIVPLKLVVAFGALGER